MTILLLNGNPTIDYAADWTTFKQWIDGTIARLVYTYAEDSLTYTIAAADGSFYRTVAINKGGSDATDFENNFKSNGNKTAAVVWEIDRAIAGGVIPNGQSGIVGAYVGTSATSLVAVRATAYTEPASAAQRSVASSSASDTSAGTGTRTIRITYYDNSMNGPFTEDITMNGTANVNTVGTNIRFIESIVSLTVGSNGGNVGTITLFGSTAGGGGTVGTIAVGDGRTYWGHHYVKAGRTMFIRQLFLNTNATSGLASMRNILPLTANDFEDQIGTQFRVINNQPSPAYDFGGMIAIPGGSRFTIYMKPDAVTASTYFVNFTYYEI